MVFEDLDEPCYRYLKFHFDCLKASNFRSEKPRGGGESI